MNKATCRIGITGQIGSGKSTVAKRLANMGFILISADVIARELTDTGEPCYKMIVSHFGNEVIDKDGMLNRKKLREIIFNKPHEKKWLEDLLHPAIRKALYNQAMQHNKVVVEIPLLNNRADYPWLDKIILVTCDSKIAIERIMKRDKSSYDEALKILSTQMSNDKRAKFADVIIDNSGRIEDIDEQLSQFL